MNHHTITKHIEALQLGLKAHGIKQITIDVDGDNPPPIYIEDEDQMGIGFTILEALGNINRERMRNLKKINREHFINSLASRQK